MNQTPENKNRLKNAVNSVAVPPYLEAGIRSQIRKARRPETWLSRFWRSKLILAGPAVSSSRAEEEDGRRSASEIPESNRRLRMAVQSVTAPPFLDARIRNRIRGEKPSRTWLPRLITVTVAAIALVAFAVTYQLGHLRLTVRSQESYIGSVSSHIATLMRVGLGDHIHCSVFRKYPKNPPSTEEFVQKMTPKYAGLIPIVRSQVPENYRMMLAHQCRYHNRKFIHLSLMNESNMLSLVMTRKTAGESFSTPLEGQDMLPALTQAGIPMYQAGVQRFQMTAFETRDYMVYFISDLSKQQNTDLMLAMAPGVKDFLAKLEL